MRAKRQENRSELRLLSLCLCYSNNHYDRPASTATSSPAVAGSSLLSLDCSLGHMQPPGHLLLLDHQPLLPSPSLSLSPNQHPSVTVTAPSTVSSLFLCRSPLQLPSRLPLPLPNRLPLLFPSTIYCHRHHFHYRHRTAFRYRSTVTARSVFGRMRRRLGCRLPGEAQGYVSGGGLDGAMARMYDRYQ